MVLVSKQMEEYLTVLGTRLVLLELLLGSLPGVGHGTSLSILFIFYIYIEEWPFQSQLPSMNAKRAVRRYLLFRAPASSSEAVSNRVGSVVAAG